MKCLLCSLYFIREQVLKKHYVDYHFINDEDIYFKDLFFPDTINKTCRICNVIFKSPRSKKNTCFFFITERKSRLEEIVLKELALYLLTFQNKDQSLIILSILHSIKTFMIFSAVELSMLF